MRSIGWQHIVVALIGLAGVWLLVGLLQTRAPDAAVTGVADRALAMADQAHQEARQAHQMANVLRLIALVVGINAPLAAVVILARLLARTEPGPAELLDVLEREGLVGGSRPALPEARETPALPSPGEKDRAEQSCTGHPEP